MKSKTTSNRVLLLSKSTLLIGVLSAVVVFIISILIVEQRRDIKIKESNLEMSGEMERINNEFADFLNDMYSGLAAITRIIDDSGHVYLSSFNEAAKQTITNNDHIYILSLIPNGITKYIYPENDKIDRDENILTSSNPEEKAAALATLKSKKITLTGPYKNKLGVDCIAAKLPIFINGKFWGFSSAVVKLKDFLEAANIKQTQNSKYNYSLSSISYLNNKETFFFNSHPNSKVEDHISDDIASLKWRLYIGPNNTNNNGYYLFILLAFIASVLAGFFVKKLLDAPLKLQSLIHEKEKHITEAEEEFKAIFDNAPIGLATLNRGETNFSAANKKFREIFELEDTLLSDTNYTKLIGKSTYECIHAQIPEVIPTHHKVELSGEHKHYNKDNTITWTNTKIFSLPHNNPEEIKFAIIAEDITEKKASEEKLKDSEKKYKHLFEESPIALWEQDFSDLIAELTKNGMMGKSEEEVLFYLDKYPESIDHYLSLVKIKSINDECFRQYNFTSKEELFENFQKIISSHLNKPITKKILAALCTRRQKFKSESSSYNAQGEIRDTILSWQVTPGHEENYDQVILTTVDITDLKKSKAQLEAATLRLQSLVDNIDGVVWMADPTTLGYTFISKKVEEITSYSAEYLMKKTVLSTCKMQLDADVDINAAYETLIRKGEKFVIEYGVNTKEGIIKSFRESVDFIKDENGNIESIIGILVNITDINNSKKELKFSWDILHQQNKRLMDFSYIVSHNLRSHTSNIQSLCELISSSSSKEEKEELTTSLFDVAQILNNTINGLNEVININSDQNIKKQLINLNDEINNTINVLNDKIKLKDANIINNVPKHINIYYNKAYIESILLNLISNSIKYSRSEIKPVININYEEQENNQKALIISDNGIGIDLDKNKEKLFGLFKTFTHNPDSKGIGLYITKRQIEAMGGNITVDSKPGLGTTFKIYFK